MWPDRSMGSKIYEIVTDQLTDRQTDMRAHREASLPTKDEIYIQLSRCSLFESGTINLAPNGEFQSGEKQALTNFDAGTGCPLILDNT